MSQADLVASLKESIHDAANVFTAPSDADFVRLLDVAALALSQYRRRTMLGEITLSETASSYTLPADFVAYKSTLWGLPMSKPWEPDFPGRLPDFRVVEIGGLLKATFVPGITARLISLLGSSYKFYYYASHVISGTASATTIRSADRGLLILRAQAEAMKEIAMRNLGKPVQMRDGLTGAPRNSTPSALYAALMQEFEQAAC